MISRIAVFLRVVDDDGNLSLTHLALYAGIGCMIAGKQVSWSEFSVFAVALASYRVKRALEAAPGVDSEAFAAMGQAVQQAQADIRKLGSPERLSKLRDGLK
jgi:hypothetical protein